MEREVARDKIFVTVKASQINNNNSTSKLPYFCTELTGEPYPLPIPSTDKSKKQCHICLKEFGEWSTLFAHQGKLCIEETVARSHLVQVHLEQGQLYYIEDALKGLGLTVEKEKEGDGYYFVVEAERVPILLKQVLRQC
jgi:hypothetical protein